MKSIGVLLVLCMVLAVAVHAQDAAPAGDGGDSGAEQQQQQQEQQQQQLQEQQEAQNEAAQEFAEQLAEQLAEAAEQAQEEGGNPILLPNPFHGGLNIPFNPKVPVIGGLGHGPLVGGFGQGPLGGFGHGPFGGFGHGPFGGFGHGHVPFGLGNGPSGIVGPGFGSPGQGINGPLGVASPGFGPFGAFASPLLGPVENEQIPFVPQSFLPGNSPHILAPYAREQFFLATAGGRGDESADIEGSGLAVRGGTRTSAAGQPRLSQYRGNAIGDVVFTGGNGRASNGVDGNTFSGSGQYAGDSGSTITGQGTGSLRSANSVDLINQATHAGSGSSGLAVTDGFQPAHLKSSSKTGAGGAGNVEVNPFKVPFTVGAQLQNIPAHIDINGK